MGKPRDPKDAAQDIARDLADIAAQLAPLKGEAHASMRDSNYDTLKHRLESAHSAVEAAAVEARRRVRLTRGGSPARFRFGEGETDHLETLRWVR